MLQSTPKSVQAPVNVVGSSTFGRYSKISAEKTYNMFISDGWLVNFPGYRKVLSIVPAGEGRGIFKSVRGGFMIVVINSIVYRVSSNLLYTPIGNLATYQGEVFIDENLNSQICIVDGINAYIYNYSLAPNLTVQTLDASLIPNYVTYHNTFFLFGNANTTGNGAKWFVYQFATNTTISLVTNGTLSLQTKPDFALAVVRIPSQGNNVLVMGSTVCEIHTQVSGAIPYRRNQTINVDYGVLSVNTIGESDQFVVWLASNQNNAPTIMVYSEQGAESISSDGIDYLLGSIQYPSQSTATMFRQDGHLFYILTFYNPADNLTLAFDFTEKKFYHLSDQYLNYHPARSIVYFNNNIYFVSLNSSALYLLSSNFTYINENLPSSNEDPNQYYDMQRIRICSHIRLNDAADRFIANKFAMTIEQGVDPRVSGVSLFNNLDPLITEDIFIPPDDNIITETGQLMVDEDSGISNAGGGSGGTNPNVFITTPPYQPRVDMSISRDGGISWSNTVYRNLNPIGYRQNILQWNKLGAANDMTFKFRFWGLDRFVVNNGIAELY